MRQVFTSPRLENVEAVAEMLRAEGIEVRISNARSYRGNRRRTFSYREHEEEPAPQSAVWIVHAEDQPRGRQLLREAGLLQSTREGASSYLPLSAALGKDKAAGPGAGRRAMRTKLVLLGLIAVVIGLMVFNIKLPQAPAPATTAAAPKPAPIIVPQSADELPVYRADVPTALARLLVERELAAHAPALACIALDGNDPSAGFMASLATTKREVMPASHCTAGDGWKIEVGEYMTDGSGRGSVQLLSGTRPARTINAEREGKRWNVQPRR